MKKLISVWITVAALAIWPAGKLSAAPADKAAATTPPSARASAEKGISQIIAILQDRNLDQPARAEKLKTIAEDFLDFETLSRLSLGPAWRDLTDAQRAEFMAEFKKHILAILNKGTKGYDDDDEVIILGDKPEQRGDHTVQTRILGNPRDGVKKEIATVDFRFRSREDRWKVIDVSIKGISLANTFRAQFLVIMKDGGIEKLLKLMRDKNASAAPDKPARTADADK